MLRVPPQAALLSALLSISACGRLGFELHEPDAGSSFVVEDTSGGVRQTGQPRATTTAPMTRRDAGRPPELAQDASVASAPERSDAAPDGSVCSEDDAGCESEGCAHASGCPPAELHCSYAERLGHGYWLCPGPVSFDAAREQCQRIGAKLATINDAAEQQALWELGMRDTWIGFRRAHADDVDAGFTWVDGSSDFEAWADDELDAGAAERCAFLSSAEQGAWQSRACDDAFAGFACELER